MKTKHPVIFCISIISLMSCVKSYDKTYPSGYPFHGDVNELNFRIAEKINIYYNYGVRIPTKLLQNKTTCDQFVKQYDTTCNCNEVDFDKENVYFKNAHSEPVLSGKFKIRLLINHKLKKMGFATGFEYTENYSGSKTSSTNVEYHKWLIIPKVPSGYYFQDSFEYQ